MWRRMDFVFIDVSSDHLFHSSSQPLRPLHSAVFIYFTRVHSKCLYNNNNKRSQHYIQYVSFVKRYLGARVPFQPQTNRLNLLEISLHMLRPEARMVPSFVLFIFFGLCLPGGVSRAMSVKEQNASSGTEVTNQPSGLASPPSGP